LIIARVPSHLFFVKTYLLLNPEATAKQFGTKGLRCIQRLNIYHLCLLISCVHPKPYTSTTSNQIRIEPRLKAILLQSGRGSEINYINFISPDVNPEKLKLLFQSNRKELSTAYTTFSFTNIYKLKQILLNEICNY
jgi:hypothetical protein